MTEKVSHPPSRGKTSLRLLRRLLLSLGATLLTLTALEIGLRILGLPKFLKPHTTPLQFGFTDRESANGPFYLNYPGRITFRYDGNPRGYFDAQNEVHHDVNPSGFRGPAFTPKPAGGFRVIFLGDSFTFGEGVRNEDTFPEVTARLLRKDGRRAESCNLGVSGYNTTQEADVLKIFGFDLKPDVVVLGYTLNDAEPPLFQIDPVSGEPVRRARETTIEVESQPLRPPDSLLYRLRLAQLVWQTVERRQAAGQTLDYYRSLNAPTNPGRIESDRALHEIISLCREHDVPCIVVMFPLLYRLSDDYPLKDVHERVGQVVRQAGGTFIDLLSALKGQDPGTLIVHPTDQHPNEKVHAIAARLIAQEIERLTDSPPRP